MVAEINELFDKIFERKEVANRYLSSLMSRSEKAEAIHARRTQVLLLRDYFTRYRTGVVDEHLQLLDNIEKIIDIDSRQFTCHTESEE